MYCKNCGADGIRVGQKLFIPIITTLNKNKRD